MGQTQPGQYSSRTRAQDVCPDTDCTGWCVIVTGANTGIGFETAKVFASRGAQVIIGCRSKERGEGAVARIKELVPNATVEFCELDLASFTSIQRFAAAFIARNIPLKVLVNNAGVMMLQRFAATEQHIEQQFGVNHLGHFFLTSLLLPQLRAGAPSRVVSLSSSMHASPLSGGTVRFPPTEKDYGPMRNYCLSKMCNVLFARELNMREEQNGVQAFSVHPGAIPTELSRNSSSAALFIKVSKPFLKSIEQGAATTLFCALDSRALGGSYHADCAPASCSKRAQDPVLQTALWNTSEELCNNWLHTEQNAM